MKIEELETPDIFADSMNLHVSPMGAAQIFGKTRMQSAGEPQIEGEKVVVVRQTVEHLKLATYIQWQQILLLEENLKLRIKLGQPVVESLGLDVSDWNKFWRYDGDGISQPATAPTPTPISQNASGESQA